jgi:hypothetical protein
MYVRSRLACALAAASLLLLASGANAQPRNRGRAPAKAAEPDPPAAPPPAVEPPSADEDDSVPPANEPPPEPPPAPLVTTSDPSDPTELPGKSYQFLGLRYRGNIIPAFALNLFVNEAPTIYTNAIGIEFEHRKDGFSIIPSLTYQEYGTGNVLLLDNTGDRNINGNWSVINSSMKGIYANLDVLWSTQLNKNFAFEYGFGVGIGTLFGDLGINWVRPAGAGETPDVTSSDGRGWKLCQTEGEGGLNSGCNRRDHQNASVAKVGGYVEPSWFDGGARPNFFPWLSVPQFGLRYKPAKDFQARLGVGFALTGFWFGLSGSWGMERALEKKN